MTLFGLYCLGMSLGLGFAWGHRRALALRIFYASVILIAHFAFVPNAHEWGRGFYMACGLAQFSILIGCFLLSCFASTPVAVMAMAGCIINTLSYFNYPSHEGVWPVYFTAINTMQTVQVLCFVFLSPFMLKVLHLLPTRSERKKTWMLRQLHSEM